MAQEFDFQPLNYQNVTSPVPSSGQKGGTNPQNEFDFQPLATNTANSKMETPDSSIIKTVTDPIIALGSGVRKGLTDVAGDVGLFASELAGKVFPKVGQKLKETGRNITSSLNKADQEMFRKIHEENPKLTALGMGTGYVGGLIGAGIGAGAGGRVADIAGQATLGASMAGEGNRAAGAATGAVLPLAISGITGSLGKYLTSNATAGPQIKHTVELLNKAPDNYPGMNIYQATDAAFDQFKGITGQIDATKSLNSVKEFITKYKSLMTPKQLSVLDDLTTDLNNAKSLSDLHQARKVFTSDLNKTYLKGTEGLAGKARSELMGLKNTIENNLQINAKQLGALEQYKTANVLYKQSREADILNNALSKTKLPEGGNNWLNFNRELLKLKADKTRELSDTTKIMISGIQKTLMEANHLLGVRTKDLGIFQPVFGVVRSLTQNPVGQAVLIKAGSQTGRTAAKEIAKSLINLHTSQLVAPGISESLNLSNGDNNAN